MKHEDRVDILLLLVQNLYMPSVDPEFITHKLNMDSQFTPKKQKPRRSAKQHVEAVKQEVEKLKLAGAIKEVYCLEWLSNTMAVKKKNGK